MMTAALEARELALIRQKYPYSPDPTVTRRGTLTQAEESELFDLAREAARRHAERLWTQIERERQLTFVF